MALMGESWASARIAHEWRRRAAAGGFDTRPFEMATNDHGDGDAVERTEGSFGAQKELAARGPTRGRKNASQLGGHDATRRSHAVLRELIRYAAARRIITRGSNEPIAQPCLNNRHASRI